MRSKVVYFFASILTISLIFLGYSFALGADSSATSTTSLNTGSTGDDEIQVLNQEIATRKDKIKQLEDTIAAYKANIDQKQTQVVSLKNQLSILDSNIQQVQTDVQLTQEKIKETELEIEALEINIKGKEHIITKQKAVIASMVSHIHASDQKNYVEVMLTYNNFSDFYNELKSIESVDADLGQSVKALRIAKEDLDTRKQLVQAKQQTYVALKDELTQKQDELNNQETAKKQLLSQTQFSEQKYQTLLSSLKQQYQVIDTEERTFEDRLRKKLEQQKKIQETDNTVFSWPVPSHIINARFHDPNYPFKNVFQHSGMDIKASYGTPVRAAASGYVARARRCTTPQCYAYVLIVHTGTLSSLYGHLSKIMVDDDQYVNRGDIIGYSGGTPGTVGAGPFVTGPHLHFEARLNGIPTDPMPYMEQD